MEGAWGGVPSLGTLEDTFGRSPDAGISLYRGLFAVRGTQRGGARMPVTLMDERRRALEGEYPSVRYSTKGT